MTDPITPRDALLVEGIKAFRLTREYVGEDMLPELPGWSWFDWCQKAEAALAASERPPVYEGLREAAQRVMDEWDALGPTGSESTLSAHRALRAALASPARPEGLDEERLTRALVDTDPDNLEMLTDEGDHLGESFYRAARPRAEAIAREYARLASAENPHETVSLSEPTQPEETK